MPDTQTLRDQLQDRSIRPGASTPRTVNRPTAPPDRK